MNFAGRKPGVRDFEGCQQQRVGSDPRDSFYKNRLECGKTWSQRHNLTIRDGLCRGEYYEMYGIYGTKVLVLRWNGERCDF
jgi:hypothetical protein